MNLHRGDVVLVRLTFHQAAGSKVRPALVLLDESDDDFVAAPITSRAARSKFDLVLTEWSAAGLNVPSCARLHKPTTIHRPDVLRAIGRLTDLDFREMREVLCQAYCPSNDS